MNLFKAIWRGQFTPQSLRVYLATLTTTFWSLIFVCWWHYPEEHAFSILTHTFSFLGSFNEDRNPGAWWLFCIAMTGWGLAAIPLVRYITRHLSPVAPKGAVHVRRLMTLGCIGITLVGLFPDARATIVGNLRWTDMHYIGALLLVLGFLIGIPWSAVLVRRAAHKSGLDEATRRAFEQARWPHALFAGISTVALFFLIRWLFVYENLRQAADAAGVEIGSSWKEAMNSPYSFPLWDNVFVYTLFGYFLWTSLALPKPHTDKH